MRYIYNLFAISMLTQIVWCAPKIELQENFCTKIIHDCEMRHGIPRELLHAIALIESGRKVSNGKDLQPWPWTINAAGKPYMLNTKSEAIQKAKSLRNKGINSIDLGPMQINMRHHPKAFTNIGEAFDIRKNAEYAANLLKQNYQKTKSWLQAVAHYHSKNTKRGEQYKRKVFRIWQLLLSRKSSDRAKPDSVIYPSTTQIKSDNGNIDIKMTPLNTGSFSKIIDTNRRFIPVRTITQGYQFDNNKAVYKLTQGGRKFIKIR